METIRAKLIVIGPHSVGKTSVVSRYQSKVYIPQTSCTVGASFSHIQVIADKFKVKMQVWDTAGQERFRSMAPMYYRGADGALLMFDLTNSESLYDLREWRRDLLSMLDPDDLVLAVVGNKCDLEEERKIRKKDGKEFAQEVEAQYFETSARDNTGVDEVFEYLAREFGRRSKNKISVDENDVDDENVHVEKEDIQMRKSRSSFQCCA